MSDVARAHGDRAPAPAAPSRQVRARAVLRALWTDLPLFLLTAGYVVMTMLADLVVDGRSALEFEAGGMLVFGAFAMVAASAAMWRLLRTGHSMRRSATWRRFGAGLTPTAAFRYLSACALIWPFLDAVGWVKSNIGTFQAYTWDPFLTRVDRALHFGHDPGDLLARVLPDAGVVRFIDWMYHPGWIAAFVVVVLWFGFVEADAERRTRVLLSCALVWIVIGSLLATAFASVGPCYYGAWIAGPDPFAPLMDGLRDVHRATPLYSVRSQAILWAGFRGEGVPLGVSAMPSVHVALTAVMALALNGRWRLLGAAFLALVLVGSVRLGWHYAVDGYVSILVVVVLWAAAGRFTRWWLARAPAAAAS